MNDSLTLKQRREQRAHSFLSEHDKAICLKMVSDAVETAGANVAVIVINEANVSMEKAEVAVKACGPDGSIQAMVLTHMVGGLMNRIANVHNQAWDHVNSDKFGPDAGLAEDLVRTMSIAAFRSEMAALTDMTVVKVWGERGKRIVEQEFADPGPFLQALKSAREQEEAGDPIDNKRESELGEAAIGFLKDMIKNPAVQEMAGLKQSNPADGEEERHPEDVRFTEGPKEANGYNPDESIMLSLSADIMEQVPDQAAFARDLKAAIQKVMHQHGAKVALSDTTIHKCTDDQSLPPESVN